MRQRSANDCGKCGEKFAHDTKTESDSQPVAEPAVAVAVAAEARQAICQAAARDESAALRVIVVNVNVTLPA